MPPSIAMQGGLAAARCSAWETPGRPRLSGGTGGERPSESPEPPAEAGGFRRSKRPPGAGGPLPRTRRTRSAGAGRWLRAACLHPRDRRRLGRRGGGAATTDHGDPPPSSFSSLSQSVPAPPTSPVPPSAPQHPQSLSAWFGRSQSVLLPPVLVRWDEAGDRGGEGGDVARSEGRWTSVCGVTAGGGNTEALGDVCHTCCMCHTCAGRLHT